MRIMKAAAACMVVLARVAALGASLLLTSEAVAGINGPVAGTTAQFPVGRWC